MIIRGIKLIRATAKTITSVRFRNRFYACCLSTGLGLLMNGCSKKQEPQVVMETKSSHGAKKVTSLTVPPSVAGKWKSVSIAIYNKPTASQKIYTVPVGGKLQVPASSMVIEVETFLPSFIMQGATITSTSNELRNPAAKVRISDKNTTLFQGWLFSLHQNTHVLIHPTYGFSLIEAQPMPGK